MTRSAADVSGHGIVAWGLVMALGGMTLTWIHLAGLGGFDLSLAYAACIGLGLLMLLRPAQSLQAATRLGQSVLPWLCFYLLYLLILALHLAGFPDKGLILRQAFFLVCGLTVATALVQADGEAPVLRRAGMIAVLGFLAISEFLAQQSGESWMTAVQRFFVQGDLNYVLYGFLRALFQAAGDGVAAASAKNIVASGLFVALVLYRAGHMSVLPDRKGQAMTLLVLTLLLIFSTRSVLLIALLAMLMATILAENRARKSRGAGLVLRVFALVSLAVLLAFVLSTDQAATARIGDRFSFADASTVGRLHQLEFALAGIEHSVLLGSGLSEINGQLVHNLFLGAWLHGGLLAFLAVLCAYVAIVVGWLNFVIRIAQRRSNWVLPARPEWVATLPLLPLLRVWIAGDAGHPGYPEWLALMIFFALLTANKHASRSMPQIRVSAVRRGVLI
ncbi:hypothetical protein [Antarctobacter sp.]|uniref:hypothetical protein n=1 Tax=Antarctobacter sp. TaxID=1872577 RepID=UPI003A953773